MVLGYSHDFGNLHMIILWGLPKSWGYPQIIHFHENFHCKPPVATSMTSETSISSSHQLMKSPTILINIGWNISPRSQVISSSHPHLQLAHPPGIRPQCPELYQLQGGVHLHHPGAAVALLGGEEKWDEKKRWSRGKIWNNLEETRIIWKI